MTPAVDAAAAAAAVVQLRAAAAPGRRGKIAEIKPLLSRATAFGGCILGIFVIVTIKFKWSKT